MEGTIFEGGKVEKFLNINLMESQDNRLGSKKASRSKNDIKDIKSYK